MALQKNITLPSGASGNYVRLTTYRWDRATREAVALFGLYVNAAAAQAGKETLSPFVAKLRLTGAKFDAYLGGPEARAGNAVAQLYAAAKAEPVISDAGADVFSNAQDV